MSRPAANNPNGSSSTSNRSARAAGAGAGAGVGGTAEAASLDVVANSTRAAALHGATRAFLPRSPSPAPSDAREGRGRGGGARVEGYRGGALAAASHAARARSPPAAAAAAAAITGNTASAAFASSTAARLTSPTRSTGAGSVSGSDPSRSAGRSAVARAAATANNRAPQMIAAAAEEKERSREQSPSHIAATLAAARAPATAPTSAAASLPSSPHAGEFIVRPPPSSGRASPDNEDDEVDRRGLLTTRQLIRSFEAHDGAADAGLAPPASPASVSPQSASSRTRSPPRAIISPVPLRPSIPLLASRRATEMFKPPPTAVESKRSPPAPPKKPAALVRRLTQQSESPASSKEVSQERSPRLSRSPRSQPDEGSRDTELLEHRRGSRVVEPQSTLDAVVDADKDDEASSSASSEDSYTSAQDQPLLLPSSAAARKKSAAPVIKPRLPEPSVPSEPTKAAPSSPFTSSPLQQPAPPRRPYSAVNYAVPDAPPLKPQLTADSLADAMVASSLAGSRVASPMRAGALATPPPPRPWSSQAARRGSRGAALLHPTNTGGGMPLISRTPSPFKGGLRHTLRAEPTPSPSHSGGGSAALSSDEQHASASSKRHHRRHRLVRTHPHKHAEGDRRQWRDVVGEPERRRYEGVWAANRGILLSASGPATATSTEDVHAYVVRDIWSRSGLGSATLAQVWELVADGGSGGGGGGKRSESEKARQLRRDEFVVGLWLVDQCLKGRRLPVEVGDSVWASVRGLMPGLRGR